MSLKRVLCLILAMALLLASAIAFSEEDLQAQLDAANARISELEAQIEVYKPWYDAQVICEYEGGIIFKEDVLASYAEFESMAASYYGINLSDYGLDRTYKEQIAQDLLNDAVIRRKAEEMGISPLDEETLAALDAEAEATFQTYIDSVAPSVDDGTMSEEQVRESAIAYLESMGYTKEGLLKSLVDTEVDNRVYAAVTEGVEVTDEDVQAAYDALTAEQQESFLDDSAYNNARTNGDLIVWNPEGYRAVKHVLILFDDDQSARYDELSATMTSLKDELALAEEAAAAGEAAETPADEAEAAVEAFVEEAGAEAGEAIEEVAAEEAAGEVEAAVEAVAEEAEAAVETAAEEAEEAVETAAEEAEAAVEAAAEEAGEAVEAEVEQAVEEAADVVEEAAGEAAEVIEEAPETAEAIEESAEEVAEEESAPRSVEEINADIAATQAELDALYAELMPTAQEVIDRFNAGTPFGDLIVEYNQDPGMQNEPTATDGYAVSAGSTTWDPAFAEGAMAIEAVGGISDPVCSSYGIHVIYYEADIVPGNVDFETVREALAADALQDKLSATYNATVDQWIEEAKPVWHLDRLG